MSPAAWTIAFLWPAAATTVDCSASLCTLELSLLGTGGVDGHAQGANVAYDCGDLAMALLRIVHPRTPALLPGGGGTSSTCQSVWSCGIPVIVAIMHVDTGCDGRKYVHLVMAAVVVHALCYVRMA